MEFARSRRLKGAQARAGPWITTASSNPRSSAFTTRAATACSSTSCGPRAVSPTRCASAATAPSRSPSGARTTISAWASIQQCRGDGDRRCTRSAPGPAARATSAATPIITPQLEAELASLHGKDGALLFTSRLCLERGGAVDPRQAASRLRDLLGRAQPRVDDRGDQELGLREARVPAQRPRSSRGTAGRRGPGRRPS